MALEEISNSLVRGEPVKLRSLACFWCAQNENASAGIRAPAWKCDQAAPRSHFQTVASPLRIDQCMVAEEEPEDSDLS